MDAVGPLDEETGSLEAVAQLHAQQPLDALTDDGDAEEEEAEQHGQPIGVAEPPQVGRQLGRACEQVVAGREALLDPVRLVARVQQKARELDRRLRPLHSRGLWAPRRRDGANWLHGSPPGRPR